MVNRFLLAAALIAFTMPAFAQDRALSAAPAQQADYVIGAQDVLVITSYDQPELTGKFTVETDGSFSYPMIGRVQIGGKTLRDIETAIRARLVEQGLFKAPEITVSIESYRSQKIYVVGEVRTPGAYPMSGNMRLVEALALAGSTQPTASGEAVIVRGTASGVVEGTKGIDPALLGGPVGSPEGAIRVDLRELESGDLRHNVALRPGDTVFVLRAESVYVFGQVKSPGAYPIRARETTVLQALSLASGVTDRGSMGRIKILRIVDGKKEELKVELSDFIQPRDTIIVPERFF
jgi:polysaccharide export outer membrane protein